MRWLSVLLLLMATGCSGTASFDRLADALNPWPEFGSSRQLTRAYGALAPPDSLTRRRVADDPAPGDADAEDTDARSARNDVVPSIRPEPGDAWPREEPRQNTLADFERSMRDGTVPPAPPRNAVP